MAEQDRTAAALRIAPVVARGDLAVAAALIVVTLGASGRNPAQALQLWRHYRRRLRRLTAGASKA